MPAHARSMARRAVSQAKNPMIIVQDPEGRHKPLHHEFTPVNGRSTVPICMIGHPDDVPGGPLFSTEAAIFERQKRERERRQQYHSAREPEASPAAPPPAVAKARKPELQQRRAKNFGKRPTPEEAKNWEDVHDIFAQARGRMPHDVPFLSLDASPLPLPRPC